MEGRWRISIRNQKNRLLDAIIKAATRLKAQAELVEQLEAAKLETQFSNAINSVKQAIPRELLIKGHNPLLLLHSAISDGIHARTDQECLELATSVREVLFELAERVGEVMKEQAALDAAVTRIMQKK